VPNPSDANTNLGIEVIASQGWWARAVAGSSVSYMGANARTSAFSNNLNMFRPGNARARGSTAFTDPAAQSAAVGGEAAMALSKFACLMTHEHGSGALNSSCVLHSHHHDFWGCAESTQEHFALKRFMTTSSGPPHHGQNHMMQPVRHAAMHCLDFVQPARHVMVYWLQWWLFAECCTFIFMFMFMVIF